MTKHAVPPLGLGHILTLVGMAAGLVAQWIHMESRMTGVEATVAALRASQTQNEARMQQAEIRARESDAEIRVGIRNLDGKITAMMMQGYRPTQLSPGPVIRD